MYRKGTSPNLHQRARRIQRKFWNRRASRRCLLPHRRMLHLQFLKPCLDLVRTHLEPSPHGLLNFYSQARSPVQQPRRMLARDLKRARQRGHVDAGRRTFAAWVRRRETVFQAFLRFFFQGSPVSFRSTYSRICASAASSGTSSHYVSIEGRYSPSFIPKVHATASLARFIVGGTRST